MVDITFDRYKSLLLCFLRDYKKKADISKDLYFANLEKDKDLALCSLDDSYKYDSFVSFLWLLYDCATNKDTFNIWVKEFLL